MLFGILMGTVGCTKSRTPSFPDGAGQDLLKIEDYDNRTDSLETNEANSNVNFISNEFESGKDKKGIGLIKNYTTSASLFPKDLVLTGQPNTKYGLKYAVTEKKLVIYKVGSTQNLAQEEQVIAEKESDGKLLVPVVSYAISGFARVVLAKDDNGDKTSRLREESVKTKSEATHFRISRTPDVTFFKENKNMLVKSNYFSGSWYTSSVISKTAEEDADLLGYQVSFDSKWGSADKIEFVRNRTKIFGMNARYDKRIKMESDEDKLNNLAPVITFPVVDYTDYNNSESRVKNHNYEGDVAGKERNWKEREWALIDFENVSTTLVENLPSNPTLTNFKMTDDFFMFSLQFKGLKVTMSFLRDSAVKKMTGKDYLPKNFFSDDFKYFGFFSTERKSLQTFEKYRKEDYETNSFINRFHPENYTNKNGEQRRRIRFVLTEESVTEENLIKVVRDSLKTWDFAFKNVGLTDVDVYLDESERASLGDIRYNTINLVRTLTSSSLFGYGPSVADPETGQIISATTNVHLTSIREYIIHNLRLYIRHKQGDFDDKYPLGKVSAISKDGKSMALDIPMGQSDTMTSIEGGSAGSDSQAPAANKSEMVQKIRAKANEKFLYGKARCDFLSNSGNFIKDIENEKQCAALVQLAKQPRVDGNRSCIITNKKDEKVASCPELDALTKCADALLPEKAAATLVHELGHNLGLRHNFAASTDETHFARKIPQDKMMSSNYSCPSKDKQAYPILARSSSSMEYTDFNEDRLTQVGPYDVEAIRYGYADKVMNSRCEIVGLDVSKTIKQNLETRNQKPLGIKFCTDEHVELKFDPFCQRHDSGVSAVDLVESLIAQYNVLFASQNFKYDKAMSPSPNALKKAKEERIFERLKIIYEQWRLMVYNYVGEKDKYFDSYTAESFKADVVEKMINDKEHGAYYKDLYKASRRIFKFMMQVVFLPDRYCLVEVADKKYDLIELTLLTKEVETTFGLREISCTSKNISSLLAKRGKFLREVGSYMDHQKASLDPHSDFTDILKSGMSWENANRLEHKREDIRNYWDVVGARADKELARDYLTQREALGFFAKRSAYAVTFLDEPDLREEVVKRIMNRVLYGISYSDLFKAGEDTQSKEFYFPKWAIERKHLEQTWKHMSMFSSQEIGREATNAQRGLAWRSATTKEKQIYDSLPENRKLAMTDGSYFIAPDAENTFTIQSIVRIKQLIKMNTENPQAYNQNRLEWEAQLGLITSVFNIFVENIAGYTGANTKTSTATQTSGQPAGAVTNIDDFN